MEDFAVCCNGLDYFNGYDWTSVASNAGMLAINSRQSPLEVIEQMRTCSRILAESLHGAICADAIGIPWAACILAHRFNELAAVQRPFSPLVIDRPLVRTISRSKALANQLARWTRYRHHTHYPALRPVAAATDEDANCVSEALSRYGKCEARFACSKPSDVARQRERMLAACHEFAKDYDLSFTP